VLETSQDRCAPDRPLSVGQVFSQTAGRETIEQRAAALNQHGIWAVAIRIFDKLFVCDDGSVTAELSDPFKMLLDPGLVGRLSRRPRNHGE
jgi:hypothetical protein